MSSSDSRTMSASSPYGTRSSTWSPDTRAKSESLSPKLCAVAEKNDQDLVYDLLSTMSDPAAQDAAATLSRVANSGAPIASTSTGAAAAAAGSSTSSSAVLAAAALMAGSNPSASTSNNASQDAEASDVAIPDPTLTVVASPNAQMPANYNKDLPMCANCLTQTTPLWRRSHDSSHILCNACALFFKMKGRPRPISLKTDVIKSRNRSKGKSTSKDRSNSSALTSTGSSATASPSALGASTSSSSSRTTSKSKERSMSRSRDAGVVGRKSGPGMDEEDAEMEDGRNKPFNDGAFSEVDSNGRKARKTGLSPNNVAFGQPPSIPPGYPGAYPYPYPYYQPHPLAPSHHHHPYAPPRSRSGSIDGRRAQSLDSRPTSAERAPAGGAPPRPGPYGYPLPPPPGYHPANPGLHATTPPEGYYPPYGYPPPPGFVGQHPMPPGYYPPPLFGAHSHAQAHAQAQAQASHAHSQAQLQQLAIAHAQSNSRSRSPVTAPTSESGMIGDGNPASRSASAGLTASPPHPSAPPNSALYPGPGQLPQGYSHSPLGATNSIPRPQLNGHDGRLTLAPLVSNGNRSPRLSDDHATMASDQNGQTERIPLPSFTAISASTAPMMPSVFAQQNPRHRRATSVSSTSAASVVSTGSVEEGVRSPETHAMRTLAAPPPRAQAGSGLAAGRVHVPGSPHDEPRGRPEKRDRDGATNNAFSSFKGKGREGAEDLSEIDELDGDTAGDDDDDAFSNGDGRRSMMNVEASLGDLRVDRHRRPHGGAYDGSASPLSSNQNDDSSRSRSSGRGTSREGRGRSRGQYGGGTAGRSAGSSVSSPKTARQRSASSSMSRNAGSSLSAEAQIRRLKTKVAELTFLNGLMVSRLSQLEGPGRVPLTQSGTMTSLSAETPRPSDDYSQHEQDEEALRDDPSEGGGDEEMYGDEALREDKELKRYGVSVSSQDPAMRQQLLAFVKAQRAQGIPGMSARAEC